MTPKTKKLLLIAIPIAVVLIAAIVLAVVLLGGSPDAYRTVKVYALDGDAEVTRASNETIGAYENMLLEGGDRVKTLKDSYLYLKLDEDKYMMAGPEAEFQLFATGSAENSKTKIELACGEIVIHVIDPLSADSSFEIGTGHSTMAIRGTSFRIFTEEDEQGVPQTVLQVFEGTVSVVLIQPDGSVSEEYSFEAGTTTVITRNESETYFDQTFEGISYVELDAATLEFLKIGLENGKDLGISEEEIDQIIESRDQPDTEEHQYGSMYYARTPNFWEDGNIAYYQCADCGKYFDEAYNEVETVVIPKYSTDLSICVNGTPTALVLAEQHENHISWTLEGLSVTKGDVITVCQTDRAEISHDYFADGNVDKDGKILTTAGAANVVLEATPNGLMLFIDGYQYEGIVIEINGEQYPMNFVTYPDGEETSYVYGYVNLTVGDKFVIVDNVSGTVYGYDDLDQAFDWNTWDFHRGDDGEFVIDFAARYGIEFDHNGNKKIYITKAFAPYDGESFGVVFESDREDEMLESLELPVGDSADNEFMWTLTHCTTMNNYDIVEYINENGLIFYYTTINLEEGEKFSLKNFTTGELIGADYLVDITGDISAVTREGDLVSVQKSGSFHIIYLPAFNSFTIECDTSDPVAEIHLYAGGNTVTLTPDENGDVFYDGFESQTHHLVAVDDSRYSPLPIIPDESMDMTLVDLTVSGENYYAYPTKDGIYNLRYNVYTNVLYLEYVGDIEGSEGESGSVDDYVIFLSVVDYTNGNQTLYFTQDPDNANELHVRVEAMAANSYISVTVMSKADYSTTTYGTLADTDSSVANNLTAEIICVKIAGPIDVYFNFETKTVRIVAVSGGGCAEGACVYDEGVVTKEPTHSEEGVKTYTCTVCGETKEEAVAKTDSHSFGDWTPDEVDETKHYKECACGETEVADCTFGESGVCTACGREKAEADGIIIVISGGTATFEGKETVTSDSKLYGENANVYVAQENDVINVTLNDLDGRVFMHWVSATGTIIPDEDFSMLVLRGGYYYPVFEDTDVNAFSDRVKVCEGNCEEGILYMSTNSKGDIKYELEYVNYGRHDFAETVKHNAQYHKQVCSICGEVLYELHTDYSSEIEKEPAHTEEGLVRYECFCGHVWTESIPATDEHTIDYGDWYIVEESRNGQYGKYRVYCKYCDYYEEYWYLGGLDFVSFMEGKMIHYQYTYGGKVSHDEYYYSYRNAEGKKVYVWAFQYEYEYSSNADYNDTYIFMYVDDENPTTIEPIYLSKSRGNRRAEYLWAVYAYAYDVYDWVDLLDSPDRHIGCSDGMLLGNSMSARSSVFESYHDYWAETYNALRIPTSKDCNDLSGTPWEIEWEGKGFQGGYYDENGEYVTTGGRDVISYVKDAGTSYKKYIHVDKETGMTYGYEDYGTYYRTVFIMRAYDAIVSPEEFEQLDTAGQSVVYSYGDIEKDIKSLCAKRTTFNNFTLTVPQTITAFRLIFSDPFGCVDISGNDTNVYNNTAHIYTSGSSIVFTWNGEEGMAFDRYEIWDFAKQEWVVLSEEANYTFNTSENPHRTAAYVRVICHEVDVPVEPGESYRISVENGYFVIDGEIHYGTVEVLSNTYVYVYANDVAGKTFEHWLDGNGEEFYDYCFYVTSDMTLSPVYTDALYSVYFSGWNYDSYVSVNGGEAGYSNEFEGKIGDTVELSTTTIPDGECTVFIGWYLETVRSGFYEYILISDSPTFTYEITGDDGWLYAVWTTGENPFVKTYVDIRVENGFVNCSFGEAASESLDNAYSAISVSNSGRAIFYDDPTDETVYTAWDVAYRYELEGEVMHDIAESFEDEYDYYPAKYWVDNPEYSYPDGVINVTGIVVSSEDPEEGAEAVGASCNR